jgi:hypothetical protein
MYQWRHCINVLLPKLERARGWRKAISGSTAARWLRRLGLFDDDGKKGVFFDGHERCDNVRDRYVFLEKFGELAQRMDSFEPGGPGGKHMVRVPAQLDGERRVVWITHDESTFNPQDIYSKRQVFREKGKVIQKQKRGCVQMMVSDFVTNETGRLLGTPQALPPMPSDQEQGEDKKDLQRRVRELQASTDPRAKLLCSLLEEGYKWAGSSLITFLGKGLVALLAALGDGHTDLDIYRTRPKVPRLHARHALRAYSAVGGVQLIRYTASINLW